MPSVISTEAITLSGGSDTLTIPAATEAILIGGGYFTVTASAAFSSPSLSTDGAPDETQDLFYEEASVGNASPFAGWVWFNPTTGSQTFSVTAGGTVFQGPTLIAVYLDDVDSAGSVSSAIDHGSGTIKISSVTLSGLTTTDDLIVAINQNYGASAADLLSAEATFTSQGVHNVGDWHVRAQTLVADSASEVITEQGPNLDNNAIVAFAFAPAAAASAGTLLLKGIQDL